METTEMVATTEPLATDVAEELESTDVMAAVPPADGSAAADRSARRTATG